MRRISLIIPFIILCTSCDRDARERGEDGPLLEISGIYPHLAFYNEDGECGTGAVVPWAGRLWAVTYGPHSPHGSADKLYEISPDLQITAREESIGGTPANRMIHPESRQLFIGPYAIDSTGKVRAIPYDIMPGRHTGNARHLTDPENKVYYATMEEGFYEVDVHSLEVHTLVPDAHTLPEAEYGTFLPGAHGKGLYSGQGVLVYSNNGETSEEAMIRPDVESGGLLEWDGEQWSLVRRNQFTEVTGPGGIRGNPNPESDPIWTLGWDHKSLLLGVREARKGWTFYRLPKASNAYDGAHGWNTEWPRIRDVGAPGSPEYLMTMHGMFWHFPAGFTSGSSAGLRPRSAYLKVVGDFARWNGRLVLGCDDAARREFLNKRKVKGGISGPGQSNSNLWFLDPELPDNLGPASAGGTVWQAEQVEADQSSDPFLFAGWDHRACWISHKGQDAVDFQFEVDREGNGRWERIKTVRVLPGTARLEAFSAEEKGEWIRIRCGRRVRTTVQFVYGDREIRSAAPDPMFRGLAGAWQEAVQGGLLYGLAESRRLGMAAMHFGPNGPEKAGYYEINERMEILPVDDPETEQFITEQFRIPEQVVQAGPSSVLVVDDRGRRWRLPLGIEQFDRLTDKAWLRISREVATERDLFSCHGTFYELPAENAGGFARIRPIASHPFRIHDYASFRGLLVLTGINPDEITGNEHVFRSADGKAAVWAGAIDDLWRMGKPVGRGGPWYNTPVEAGQTSDPFLIGFYDTKILELSHASPVPITFHMEVDPLGDGNWMPYQSIIVPAGESYIHLFPEHFQARWIRFSTASTCVATTWFEYQ